MGNVLKTTAQDVGLTIFFSIMLLATRHNRFTGSSRAVILNMLITIIMYNLQYRVCGIIRMNKKLVEMGNVMKDYKSLQERWNKDTLTDNTQFEN